MAAVPVGGVGKILLGLSPMGDSLGSVPNGFQSEAWGGVGNVRPVPIEFKGEG